MHIAYNSRAATSIEHRQAAPASKQHNTAAWQQRITALNNALKPNSN
jgi:hypothetical protein